MTVYVEVPILGTLRPCAVCGKSPDVPAYPGTQALFYCPPHMSSKSGGVCYECARAAGHEGGRR